MSVTNAHVHVLQCTRGSPVEAAEEAAVQQARLPRVARLRPARPRRVPRELAEDRPPHPRRPLAAAERCHHLRTTGGMARVGVSM